MCEALEQAIEEARTSLTDTNVLRGKLEGEINVLKEQINSAQSNTSHLHTRQETIKTQINEKEKEKQSILDEKSEAQESAEKLSNLFSCEDLA